MRSRLFTSIKGYVKIEVRGREIEVFLNRLIADHTMVWDIRRKPNETIELKCHIKDFFAFRPLLKQTGCRVHVLERYGLPFYLDRLEGRKFFVAGLIGFIIALYLLSRIVWNVQVEGNERIPKEDILQVAKAQGIYPLQWKFRLKDSNTLSKELARQIPGVSWVGVEIKGTQVHIQVVEATLQEQEKLMSPRHIVSASDAVVTEIFAEKGVPKVAPNTRVKAGEILISGVLGDEENQQAVVAKGKVKGLVWHTYQVEIPLVLKRKVYTGEWKTRQYLVVGNRALQVSGYGGQKYDQYQIEEHRSQVHWRNFSLPIGWIKEKVMEVKYEEKKLEKNEAKHLGLQQARADILAKNGQDAEIKGEKILDQKVENGRLIIKVLYEVEQNIGKEQPIVQEIQEEDEDK